MSAPIQDFICFKFYTGWREIDQFYKQVLGKNISPQITYVLQLCFLDSDTTVNEIATSMKLNNSAVSNLIARMEKKGLVKRIHSLDDRRVVNVRLTKKGDDLMSNLREKIQILEKEISQGITNNDKNVLRKIVDNISESRINNIEH